MKRNCAWVIMAVLALSLVLAGCGAAGETPSAAAAAGETAAGAGESAAGEAIKVGVIQDTSGATSAQGLSVQRGIELAVEEMNAKGGIDGHPIELYSYDCKADPQEAIVAYQRLASVDGVSVVLGPPLSNVGLACIEATAQAEIPFLGAFAINKCMINPDNGEVYPYMFAVQPTAEYSGATLADYVMNKLGYQSFAILGRQDQAYLVASCDEFVKTVEANGGAIVSQQNCKSGDMDYKVQINNMVESKPDMLVIFLETNDTVIFLNQVQQLGIDLPIGATNSAADPMLSMLDNPAGATDIYFTNNLDVGEEGLKEIRDAYQAKFNTEADIKSFVGYDLVLVLEEAVKQAGATDSESIRNALENSIQDLAICQGTLTMSPQHMPIGLSMVMYEIKDGDYTVLERYAPEQ